MTYLRPTAVATAYFVVAVGCAAGANSAALQPQLSTPEPSDSEVLASSDPGAATEDVEVQVDLSANGIGALIRAPKTAAVRAASSEVEIVGGPDYHLLVGRGAVDPLGEKSRIVRAYGDEFRRYLRDESGVLVYETGSDQEQRYHFFMNGQAESLDYHCRTPPKGMGSEASVEHMVEVCQGVEASTDAQIPDL